MIIHPAWKLYIAEKAWEEAGYELNKRITIMIEKKVFSSEIGYKLLDDAFALAEMNISLIPDEFYSPYKTIALGRIPRDPNDWPTVALALFLKAGIWTSDRDFLGCGLPTWTTDNFNLLSGQ